MTKEELLNARRFWIVACGTSWHAGLVGKYLFEEMVRRPIQVDIASEFRYREPLIQPNDVFIAISQSGETADTLAARARSEAARGKGVSNRQCRGQYFSPRSRRGYIYALWAGD